MRHSTNGGERKRRFWNNQHSQDYQGHSRSRRSSPWLRLGAQSKTCCFRQHNRTNRCIDAPYFVTVTVSDKAQTLSPGNVHPIVGLKLINELEELIRGYSIAAQTKASEVINALMYNNERMSIGGRVPWWDNTYFRASAPFGMGIYCLSGHGRTPVTADCERASFQFIKRGITPRVQVGAPLSVQYGVTPLFNPLCGNFH